jgi:hypothetical protein
MSQTQPGFCIQSGKVSELQPNIAGFYDVPGQTIFQAIAGSF